MSDLLGLWPIASMLVAAIIRVVEVDVRRDQASARDRYLAELLAAGATVLVVAGGVGLGLLFGRRIGL